MFAKRDCKASLVVYARLRGKSTGLSTLSKRYRIGSLFALRLSEKRVNCIYVLLDFCSADCAFLKRIKKAQSSARLR